MMTSLAQAYSPHPGGIHPGVPQGHPMAVPHNPGQPGQPGMPQQMHMGVSGPGGPQVSQAGALMGGMPPGAGVPSAHALQHLNPNAAAQQHQMLQQQQQMAFAANNPNFQMQHQQQAMIAQQRAAQQARQQMLAQHYSGMPVNMPNGMNQMTQAQYQAMRGGPTMARPVNLPQHLQQQQAGLQAQHTLEQQQQAQAQHQHQQQMMAQQMAMQQQANAQNHAGNNQGQQNQLSSQQIQNLQQAQLAQVQQQQQQAAAAAAQQNQPPQSQPQPQAQTNPQAQPQVSSQQPQPQVVNNPQQQQALTAARMAQIQQAQQQGEKQRGQCILKLMLFADHLSNFTEHTKPLETYMAAGGSREAALDRKRTDDLNYWNNFVYQFFSPKGVMRHSLWMLDESSNKQYEIPYAALNRYFHTHFESGVKMMQLISGKGSERSLPNNGHYIDNPKSTLLYWFNNGSQLAATGSLRALFDSEHKIELLEFVTNNHEEHVPRSRAMEAMGPIHEWIKEWHKLNTAPEGKQSPELNKKKPKPMRSPANPPPEFIFPQSNIKPNMGITSSVFRFFELSEVMGQMGELFHYSHQHPSMSPKTLLEQYVATVVNTANGPGQQQNPAGPRTPGMPNFQINASPAAAHLQLPDGSPLVTGSPAQAPGMQLQHSQHGTSSSGPSANTSPNASNKRRRPSAVKTEEEPQVNGAAKSAVRPSPRLTKKQKPNGPGP